MMVLMLTWLRLVWVYFVVTLDSDVMVDVVGVDGYLNLHAGDDVDVNVVVSSVDARVC